MSAVNKFILKPFRTYIPPVVILGNSVIFARSVLVGSISFSQHTPIFFLYVTFTESSS
jgi:hypothetical protein